MSRTPSSTPWPTSASGAPSSSSTSAAPPQPLTPPAPPAAAHPPFSSTWGAFNLAQPRSQPSNLTLALERGFGASPIPSTSSSTLPPPPQQPSSSSSSHHHGQGGAAFGRRMSTLGQDVPMTMTWDDEGEGGHPHQHQHHHHADSHRGGGTATPNGDDMMSMSPAAGDADLLPPPHSASMFRSTRSRSGSASSAMLLGAGAGNAPSSSSQLFPLSAIPPSPVTLARALQHGAKTPPPFLQRRLFKEDGSGSGGGTAMGVDETASGSGRSSRSGSSSDVGMSGVGGKTRAMRIAAMTSALPPGDDDDEIDELSAVLSRSASAGPEDLFERVVRRPVSRKPNLLPKPKSHLRILSELRSESSGDQEIVSEATLHRLSRAGASAVPPGRTGPPPPDPRTAPTSSSAPAASSAHPASFASRAAQQQHARPTPNRFPEQAGTEDEDLLSHRMGGGSSSSSNDEAGGDEAIEVGSDWGAMSVGGDATEDDEERRSNVVWNGIRSGPGGSAVTVATPFSAGSMARSPHGDRRLLDYENPFAAPQTPSTTFAATRPGKRKMGNDDRFEPYAHQAFKRRAVSPAASLSLSPGFAAASAASHASSSASTSSRPTPPPLPLSALGSSSQPVAIPSPSSSSSASASASHHHHFFHAVSSGVAQGGGGGGTRSAASSLSSSTGRGLSAFSMGMGIGVAEGRHRSLSGLEERERALAHKLDPDGLGRMSLEGGGAAGDEEEL
ncbi:hypothetical protein JCM8208_004536 [Rhodotorula glutinis]